MRTTFAAVAALGMAVSALAATYTVTETTDNATGAAGTLSAAINSSADNDAIVFNLTSGDTVTLTAALPTLTHTLTIQGLNQASGKPVTVQVAEPGVSPFRVFRISPATTDIITTLQNLILRGGNVTATSEGVGGVIYINKGDLSLTDCVLRDGVAVHGGGIAGSGTVTHLTLDRCTVTGNEANGNGGGCISRVVTRILLIPRSPGIMRMVAAAGYTYRG